jgi:hypothetical protein
MSIHVSIRGKRGLGAEQEMNDATITSSSSPPFNPTPPTQKSYPFSTKQPTRDFIISG